MALLKKIYLLSLPLLLTSCWENFDPRIDTKPVLCLNSLITAGQPIEVKVTRTWVFTDEEGTKDHSVTDAVVEIYANGQLVDSEYLPEEGDRIRIHASSLKYGEAEAEVSVPFAPEISNVVFSPKVIRFSQTPIKHDTGIDADFTFDIRISMDFENTVAADDFYRLSYLTYMPHGIMTYGDLMDQYGDSTYYVGLWGENFDALDPVFYEQTDPFEDIMGGSYYTLFFSDRQFRGKTKSLTYGFSDCRFLMSGWDESPEALDCGWLVTLFSISESYYNWLSYADQASGFILSDLTDIGLSEPVWGYSNVSTGAGVVAAQSSATVTIDLRDFLLQTLEDA